MHELTLVLTNLLKFLALECKATCRLLSCMEKPCILQGLHNAFNKSKEKASSKNSNGTKEEVEVTEWAKISKKSNTCIVLLPKNIKVNINQ